MTPSTNYAYSNPLVSFDLDVWLALLSASCIISVVLSLPSLIWKKREGGLIQLLANAVDALLMFTGQSSIRANTITKHTITLVGVWALTAAMIAGLFSGNILITLMQQKAKPPFKDLISLANCIRASKCTVGVRHINSFTGDQLTTSQDVSTGMKEIQQALKETGSLEIIDDPETVIKRIFFKGVKQAIRFLREYILCQHFE